MATPRRLSPALALTLFGVGVASFSVYPLNFPTVGGTAFELRQTNIAGPNGTGYLHFGLESQRCADMDGDGDTDIVTGARPSFEGVHVGLKRSGGLHYDVSNYGNGLDDNDAVWGFDLSDVDADGDVDVVTLERSAALVWSLQRYSNDGAGVLSRSTILELTSANLGYGAPFIGDDPIQPLVLGDFNGDGSADIAVATGYRLEVFHNDGSGSFTRGTPVDPSSSSTNDYVRDLQMGDLDGDGALDLMGAAWNLGAYVFKGDGAGGFTMNHQFATAAALWSNGDLGDVDADGDLDVVLTKRKGSGQAQLFYNDGTGAYVTTTGVSTGGYERGMFLDVDGDGDDDDYLTTRLFEAAGGVLRLRGTVSGTNNNIRGACDLDGDGDLEALFGNYAVSTLATELPGGGGADVDGWCESEDNCQDLANADQLNADNADFGDVCEADTDGDGVIDDFDNCDDDFNADQANTDTDGRGDACDDDDDADGLADGSDNCPLVSTANQANFDGDGLGDACDGDDDADGVNDTTDLCPSTPMAVLFNSDGCSGAQYVALTVGSCSGYPNQGQYVSAVTHAANNAVRLGIISANDKALMIRNARSSCR